MKVQSSPRLRLTLLIPLGKLSNTEKGEVASQVDSEDEEDRDVTHQGQAEEEVRIDTVSPALERRSQNVRERERLFM